MLLGGNLYRSLPAEGVRDIFMDITSGIRM